MPESFPHTGENSFRPDDMARTAVLAVRHKKTLPHFIDQALPQTDILAWLYHASAAEKFFFTTRNGQVTCGGIGRAMKVSPAEAASIIAMLPEAEPIFFFGRRFDINRDSDDVWAGFPDDMCLLPEMMIYADGLQTTLRYCLAIEPDTDVDALAERAQRLFEYPVSTSELLPPPHDLVIRNRLDCPDRDGWRTGVENCLEAIQSKRLEKIVMARRTDYDLAETIAPELLLSAMMRYHRIGYGLLYQPAPGRAFVSVSPERLFRRHDGRIDTDALSSTLPRGASPADDNALELSLMRDKKLRHEHQIVIDGITADLTEICNGRVTVDETGVVKLEHIQHLRTRVWGTMAEGISDGTIIEKLHPTPAVGGRPRREALHMIAEQEKFDRGWYAAPVGLLSRHRSEACTAIRSAVLSGSRLSVFTGAGIVDGSDPVAEWDEIDSKNILSPLLQKRGTR